MPVDLSMSGVPRPAASGLALDVAVAGCDQLRVALEELIALELSMQVDLSGALAAAGFALVVDDWSTTSGGCGRARLELIDYL
jgi:hypothetical protein